MALLDDEMVEIFASQESELVPYLIPLTVAGVSRAMGAWVRRARPEPTEPNEPERSLHLSSTIDDRWILDATLDPEGGATVAPALRRRADALVEICRFFSTTRRAGPGGVTARTSM